MAHHSEQLPADYKRFAEQLGLGPTGKYPMGKIHECDAGEIAIGIATDLSNDIVVLNFGSPVSWCGLTADEAIEIANCLTARAMELKTIAH